MRLLLYLLMFFFVGCLPKSENVTINHKWLLKSIDGKGINTNSLRTKPIINIDAENKIVNGSDGCNSFLGIVDVIDRESIRFSDMSTTLISCGNGMEYTSLSKLIEASTYRVRRDGLFLYNDTGKEILSYKRP